MNIVSKGLQRSAESEMSSPAGSRRVIAGISAAVSALCVSWVAQAAQPAPVGEALEEVVITGSYLASAPKEQAGTLQTVGAEEIARSNKTSIAALLAQLPSTMSSQINGASNDQGNNPAASINLRGLGPRATLILLNGQRQVPISEAGGVDDFSIDINSLVPTVLINRVEVLKDGASALYGSDAVAGVVNFITRTDLNGAVIDGSLNTIDAINARKNGRLSLAFGTKSGGTSITVGGEYNYQDQVFVSDVYDRARITRYGQTSAFSNPPTFFPAGGAATADPLCGSSQLGGSPNAGLLVAGRCRQDLTLFRGMIAGTKRATLYSNIKHEINDNLDLNVELGGANLRMVRYNSVGFPANTTTFTFPSTNPANTFGVNATMNYRVGSAYSGTIADTEVNSNLLRARIGLDWKVSEGWRVKFSAAQGVDRTYSGTTGYMSSTRLQAALNCRGGVSGTLCFNPMGSAYLLPASSPLANSRALLDWMNVTQSTDSSYNLKTLDAVVTGDLFDMSGGKAKLAVGLQRRQESTVGVRDPATLSGDITFGGANSNYNLQRSVNALFAEVLLPVTSTFEASLAGRYEKSDPGSGSFNPKLGLSWRPLDDLNFTATIGKSERSPGLLQYIQRSSLVNIARDPVTGNAQNGVAVLLQAATSLSPEQSTNTNLGVTWTPTTSFGSAKLGLTYWNIDFKNLITTSDAAALVLAAPNAPNIQRDPVSGQIILITIPGFFNANQQKLTGFDFDGNLRFNAGSGASWFVSLGGTLMTKYQQVVGGVTSDLLGYYNSNEGLTHRPRQQGILGVGYTASSFEVTAYAHYMSALKESRAALVGLTEEKAYKTIDLNGRYNVNDKFSLNAGITNLGNSLPPAQGNSIYTTNSNAYPLTGRAYNVGFHLDF